MAPPRILAYSPYGRWTLHARQEMTILQACRLRGAEVEYVLCDGLYSDCDQYWGVVEARPEHACRRCQADQARVADEMGMDYRWLGRYLTTDEEREARRWGAEVPVEELLTATYGAWPVAAWVRLSLQSHFRSDQLDALADPEVARVARSYLTSGLIACFALRRLLDESAPDVLVLFNGRMASPRVALELARERGIRTIVHERGFQHESLMLVENVTVLSLEPARTYWREWRDVPLTAEEANTVAEALADRAHGRRMSWTALTAPVQEDEVVRAELGLSADRPLWALFTSSDDEVNGDPDYASPFASQGDWIAATIDHARRHPEIDLVVRVHPNTGSRRSQGANRRQVEEFERLAADLPGNVQLILPETEISSYSLMSMATAGLVWNSTVALEMSSAGKAVVVAAGNAVHGLPFVRTTTAVETYEDDLLALHDLPLAHVDPEVRRGALRFAYGFLVRMRIPFGLVRNPTTATSELAYRSLEDLLPGKHAGLDRCVRVVLDGEPVCPPPTAAQRARSTAEEDAFLAGRRPRVTALAFAEELIADASLLQAWAAAFDGRDDATLLIHTLAEHAEALVATVTAIGLAGDDGPDLVALEADADTIAGVDAILSRLAEADALTPPRVDETTLAGLAG